MTHGGAVIGVGQNVCLVWGDLIYIYIYIYINVVRIGLVSNVFVIFLVSKPYLKIGTQAQPDLSSTLKFNIFFKFNI